MIAFSLSAAALSRIATICRRCSAAASPGLVGQSMFPTVATHAARNSRATGGGGWCDRQPTASSISDSEGNTTKARRHEVTRRENEDRGRRIEDSVRSRVSCTSLALVSPRHFPFSIFHPRILFVLLRAFVPSC